MLQIKYDVLPPSLNNTYRAGNGVMYMKAQVKSFKDLIKQATQGVDQAIVRQLDLAQFHEIHYVFTGNFAQYIQGFGWVVKASKPDFGNEIKALQDAIYGVLALDDRRACFGSIRHAYSETEQSSLVTILPTMMMGIPLQ
jgi:Holliday junction resolvase RusA-like endonuclease